GGSAQRRRATSRHSPFGLFSRLANGSGFPFFAVAYLPPEFLPIHGRLGRRLDTESDGIAFNRDDGDLQPAIGDQNTFTNLATEDEHENSSLKLASCVPTDGYALTDSPLCPDRLLRQESRLNGPAPK